MQNSKFRFFFSFPVKLALAFTFVVVVLFFTVFMLCRSWVLTQIQHLEQEMGWYTAYEAAQILTAMGPIDPAAEAGRIKLKEFGRKITRLHGRSDFYVIDQSGTVILAPADYLPEMKDIQAERRVDMEPVRRFLATTPPTELTIIGTDPTHSMFQDCSISVAPVMLDGQPFYVYVALQGYLVTRARQIHLFNLLPVIATFVLSMLALCSSFLGVYSFRYLNRRFLALTRAVREIGQGRLDTRIPADGRDEVAELAETINGMASQIQRQIKQLNEIDESRRQMAANIAHDLSGPLSASLGYVERALKHDQNLLPAERQSLLQSAMNTIDGVLRQVRRFFELAKLDSPERAPELDEFSLSDLISEEILPKFSPLAEDLGIKLSAELPPSCPLAYGDMDMIETVIANLVENALSYTPQGGRAALKVEPVQSGLRIAVSDTGQGIAARDLPHIFQRFYRGENRISNKQGSSGLGLAIVKQILQAHGTEIEVASTLGAGTTFSFILPAR